jgi:antitoxin (DNA-binding transcriptional repressor) of toxin-antitoxin stability system
MTMEEAQARLPELIDSSPPGEEVVLTHGNQPVPRLIPQRAVLLAFCAGDTGLQTAPCHLTPASL